MIKNATLTKWHYFNIIQHNFLLPPKLIVFKFDFIQNTSTLVIKSHNMMIVENLIFEQFVQMKIKNFLILGFKIQNNVFVIKFNI